MRRACLAAAALAAAVALAWPADETFTFAILGDRAGDIQDGVYEQALREAAAEHPAFILTTGDSIEGADDAKADAEWRQVQSIWNARRAVPLYVAPGNHDIWSAASERLYQKYTGHPPHYSFDHAQAHFTILDNSRSDELSADQLAFAESDLKAHSAAAVKFLLMHRPSWIISVALANHDFPLHRLARQYGVQYVVAGHIHQMLRFELDGINYISMPSSGGHLRLSKAYEDGWFFGHAKVGITGSAIDFAVEETKAPHGQGRVSKPSDWGATGLRKRSAAAAK